MGTRWDVTVVGGGIVGALTATRLVTAGLGVVLVGDPGTLRTTDASAAVIRVVCEEPELAVRSLGWYADWMAGLPARAPRPVSLDGVLVVVPAAADEVAAEAAAVAGRVRPGAARACRDGRVAGYATGEGTTCWFEPGSGWAHPRLAVLTAVRRLDHAGGTVARGRVERLRRVGGCWRLDARDRTGRPLALPPTPAVVVAAGAGTPGLLPDPCSRRPVTRRPASVALTPVRLGRRVAVVDLHDGLLLHPTVHGVLAAARTEHRGPAFVREVRARVRAHVRGPLAHLPARVVESSFDLTPDGRPFVGTVDTGLHVAYGLNGGGFKLAPALAEELARLVLDGRPGAALRHLDPLRHARPGAGSAADRYAVLA